MYHLLEPNFPIFTLTNWTTLAGVKYNTRLRERSLKRRQNVDLILVEETDSDDEWIAEKEDLLLPLDAI